MAIYFIVNTPIDRNDNMDKSYAAVDEDGMVWGDGDTPDEAGQNALQSSAGYLEEDDYLFVHPVRGVFVPPIEDDFEDL